MRVGDIIAMNLSLVKFHRAKSRDKDIEKHHSFEEIQLSRAHERI